MSRCGITRTVLRSLILFAFLFHLAVSTHAATARPQPGFAEWKAACAKLPTNRQLRGRLPPARVLPLQQFAELETLIDQFFHLCRTSSLSNAEAWLGGAPGRDFFDSSRAYFSHADVAFAPFVQRLAVPPDAEVIFNGDLHGDVASLLGRISWLNQRGYLNGFQLVNTNTFIVFLGDYADRGVYGLEVFYTVLRLKLANPDRVLLGRGNHEDLRLAADYGLLAEGQAKYGARFNARKVARLFDFLPAALYVGCDTNYIQACHAGVEPGFHPGRLLDAPSQTQFQLVGDVRQRTFIERHSEFRRLVGPAAWKETEVVFQDFRPASPTQPYQLGFLWNDFTVVSGEPTLRIDAGRGVVWGEEPTRFVLKASSGSNATLRAIFRAHQHSSVPNPMMRRLVASQGVFQHWQTGDSTNQLEAPVPALARQLDLASERRISDGSVWTFNVSPDSVYGVGCDFDFDAFGILRVSENFHDWRLRVVNPVGTAQ